MLEDGAYPSMVHLLHSNINHIIYFTQVFFICLTPYEYESSESKGFAVFLGPLIVLSKY